MSDKRPKWEIENRMPTEAESMSMSSEEYDYLNKLIEQGFPRKEDKKKKDKMPPKPPKEIEKPETNLSVFGAAKTIRERNEVLRRTAQ